MTFRRLMGAYQQAQESEKWPHRRKMMMLMAVVAVLVVHKQNNSEFL